MIVVINRKIAGFVIIATILALIAGFILLRVAKTKTVDSHNHNNIPNPIRRGNENSKYIAFACNVDWGNEVLPDMLSILNEEKIKITFFVTGRWAEEFPDLMQQIVSNGHEIGSHGYQHLNYETLTLEQNEAQIKEADEILSGYIGEKIALFAPPSGAYNDSTLIAADKLGYKTILWTIDTIDWRAGSTEDIIINRVLKKDEFNGAIVLMHPMPETAKALPGLISSMREKNLKVGTVSDVLE